MSSLVFEKSITRDWSLVFAQAWHEVYAHEFTRQFGWGYTEVVFEAREGALTIYRPPSEHLDGMRHFILTHLGRDPNWLDVQAEEVQNQVRLYQEWHAAFATERLDALTNARLRERLREYLTLNVRLGPRYLMMLWFPIQMEAHPLAEQFARAIQAASVTRAKIDKIAADGDGDARALAAEVLRRANLDVTLAKYATISELDALLAGQADTLQNSTLTRRKREPFLLTNQGVLYTPLEDYLHAQRYELHKPENKTGGLEVRGTPAKAGLATGRVRIVRSKHDFPAFQHGEILVAAMTTPDFMPLIQKAAAIVTNEGGMTCHAAIVAREFNIPCVVGTRVATHVLKTGDEVTVDATNGIVRKKT